MRKRIAFLDVRSDDVIYNINIYSKYTVITGFSGTGKSQLIKMLDKIRSLDESSQYNNNPQQMVVSSNSVGIITNNFLPKMSFETDSWLNSLQDNFRLGSIICVDEDFRFLHTKSFQAAMVKFKALFVIVCRDRLQFLPYGVDDIFRLCLSDDGEYHHNHNVCNSADFGLVEFNRYNQLCTEDSGSGNKFFNSFLRNVSTSNGKTNISRLIQEKTNTVFCIDGLGFGSEMLDIMSFLDKFKVNNNALWIIDSFESMILTSDWFKQTGVSCTPDPDAGNLEQASTQLLREVLGRSRIRYSKRNLPLCFIKDCCFDQYRHTPSRKCNLFCPGNKLELILGRDLLNQLIAAFGDARIQVNEDPVLVGVESSPQKLDRSFNDLSLVYDEISDEDSKDSEDERNCPTDLNTDLFTSVF